MELVQTVCLVILAAINIGTLICAGVLLAVLRRHFGQPAWSDPVPVQEDTESYFKSLHENWAKNVEAVKRKVEALRERLALAEASGESLRKDAIENALVTAEEELVVMETSEPTMDEVGVPSMYPPIPMIGAPRGARRLMAKIRALPRAV